MAISNQKRYQDTIITSASLLLSAYGTLRYLILGHKHINENDPFDVGMTPFTPNTFFVFIYWGFLYVSQSIFVLQYFVPSAERTEVAAEVGGHFATFNVLTFLWTLLFGTGHYVWSELIAIANLFNLLVLMFIHKTYLVKGLKNYATIHISATSLPLAWILYIIFWNGAAMFGASTGLAARILANIFIWNFLLVPAMVVVLFGDWSFGFATSFLMFGLGLSQMFTKVFALQWLFAFIISGLDFVFGLLALGGVGKAGTAETAPLLE